MAVSTLDTRSVSPTTSFDFDIIVYGGTPSGVIAAISATRTGARVRLLEPSQHLGGIIANGLGVTNAMERGYIRGLVQRFHLEIGKRYGLSAPKFEFEPKVAKEVFEELLDVAGVSVIYGASLSSVAKTGNTIKFVDLVDGSRLSASQWIDSSYEGDLMAKSGVSYSVGREASTAYEESYAGWGSLSGPIDINPYTSNGQFLSGIHDDPRASVGAGDQKIMAYTYRTVITTDRSNMTPFWEPPQYDPAKFLGVSRFIQAAGLTKFENLISPEVMPANKSSLLGSLPFSADYIGAAWAYPDGDISTRRAIIADHLAYVAGFLYFLSTDHTVPLSIRNGASLVGLPLDEFTDNDHWPWQMYIREARRMKGQYILKQSDLLTATQKEDPVTQGNWAIDSHICDGYAISASGGRSKSIGFDGSLFEYARYGYHVPLRIMMPDVNEVSNLAVTVCLSATHIAFSSLRVEPTHMALGEVAGLACSAALQANRGVAEMSYAPIRKLMGQYNIAF